MFFCLSSISLGFIAANGRFSRPTSSGAAPAKDEKAPLLLADSHSEGGGNGGNGGGLARPIRYMQDDKKERRWNISLSTL